MRVEEAASWYRTRGFRIDLRPLLGPPEARLRPDLVAERAGERRAVLAPEKPAAKEALEAFAAACRPLGLVPIYAGPLDPALREECHAVGIEALELAVTGGTDFLSRFSKEPEPRKIVGAVFPRLASPEGQAIVATARRREETKNFWLWIVVGFLLILGVIIVTLALQVVG